jgi:hypothetical protein
MGLPRFVGLRLTETTLPPQAALSPQADCVLTFMLLERDCPDNASFIVFCASN